MLYGGAIGQVLVPLLPGPERIVPPTSLAEFGENSALKYFYCALDFLPSLSRSLGSEVLYHFPVEVSRIYSLRRTYSQHLFSERVGKELLVMSEIVPFLYLFLEWGTDNVLL